MKIYTRTGDNGTTGIFGGDRVGKDHPRIQAYGTVDETNSAVGLALAHLYDGPGYKELSPVLLRIQNDLFVVGADLATPLGAKPVVPRIGAEHVRWVEEQIDRFDEQLPALKHFILPGGTPSAASLHLARTICRRAERLAVETAGREELNHDVIIYLNRLSDLLFVLARWANDQAGLREAQWTPEPS